MTEPLDVALRVKLAYEAGGARSAVGDLEAIRAGAKRLATSTSVVMAARDMAGLGKAATLARVGVDELARAGARLQSAAGGGARLAADVGAIARPAQAAKAELAGAATAAEALTAAARGITSGDGLSILSRDAVAARRALSDTTGAAADLEKQIDALLASAGELQAWTPAQAAAAMKAFDAQMKSGRAEIGQLEAAAAKIGREAGPAKLADGVAAVTPAAVEARRHIDDVGTAARTAERELARMGRAATAAGGAEGGATGGGHGSGGGGLRGALIAGARPLRMERLVMSAMSPVGAAGLAGGLGLAEIGRGLKAVTDQAINFESAMVEVRRAASDMPAAGVKQLGDTILGVSRATGTSATELAAMAAAATRAGRPVADLHRFLDLGAKAANVMGVSVDEAGQKLVQLGRGWGKDEAGLEDTADAVALASEKLGARAGGVLDFTNRFSNLRARGMSARQVAAFGAAFQGAGLDPGQAEGTFGSLSEKLANPQNAGPQFEADLGRLGVGPSQARVGMRTDPTRAMMDVLERLKSLPDVQRVPMMERMFGPEGGRDIGRVVDHLDDLKRALGLVENQAERSGALERSFKLFDDTTRAKIDKMGEAAGRLATELGRVFSPAAGASADAMAKAFDAATGFLERNERAGTAAAILDAKRAGTPLTDEQKAAIAADPKLKAMTGGPDDELPPLAPSLVPSPPVPRSGTQPELTDPEISAARAASRERLEGRVRELEGQQKIGAGGPDVARQIEGARRRLEQFDRAARPPGDKHADAIDPSMIHRASYVEGEARPAAGGSATDALRAVLASATKEGVVEGLREVLDMRGGGSAASGIVPASYTDGSDSGASEGGVGDSAGGGGGRAGRSIRYGGGFRADHAAMRHRSLRYGGGYGPKGMGGGGQAYGAAVPGANGFGLINAPYTAPIDKKGEGGQLSPKELFGYLKAHGATDNEATMLTGAAGSESSFNPNAVHDGGRGHGLWGHNDHRIDMRGKTWQQQADLALGEVKAQYADRVNGAKTPEELADAEMHFERPRGYSARNPRGGDNYTGRANTLRRFGDAFGTMHGGDPGRGVTAGTGSAGTGDAVGLAEGMLGANSQQAQAALKHRMTPGEWCADFVNGVIEGAGGKGVNSSMARAFAQWGKAVGTNDAKRGDVILERHGDHIGHVGMATGKVQRDRNGNVTHVEMISGNYGHAVRKNMEPVGIIAGMRRGSTDEEPQVAERQPAKQRAPMLSPRAPAPRLVPRSDGPMTTASAGGVGQRVASAPAVQNFYGMHDPAQTARMAMMEQNREVRRSQARALHSVGRVA